MFSIFTKKTYLIDLLEGITDFHNHLLPGIDDGAKDEEESESLIKKFKSFGIEKFVATPHVMGEYYPNTPDTIHQALKNLKNHLKLDLQIRAAAEYMMDQHFLTILQNNELLPVINKNVLVEMSYFQAPINLNEILFKLQNQSFTPILAHPERYAYYHSKNLEDYKNLKERGCKFQLNMLSITGHYGKNIQRIAFNLLDRDMIDFIASDVHRIEHLEKIERIILPKKHLENFKKIVSNNKSLFD